MTDREKAIVMAYTGICMLSGDKFKIFHKYVENIMGRPVYTHEMAIKAVDDEIKEKSKADFIALCAEQETKTGHWIEVIDEIDSLGNKTWHQKCSICGNEDSGWGVYKYCPNCGARMIEQQAESEDEE